MKKVVYIITVVFVLTSITSCNKDFLDKQPLDQFSEETVWTDLSLMETFVNNIYAGVPHGFSNMMMASIVDESMYNADFGSSNVTKSLITPSDYSVFDVSFWSADRYRFMTWTHIYQQIRACNLFLSKVESNSYEDEDMKNRLTGEVHFLRAYNYQNLVLMYGGVPLITKAYELNDDFLVPRNTFEECINFIADECDQAAALLPLVEEGGNAGRATKGAALALKSRILLYAASDLYHDQSWAGNYEHPELIGYTSGDRTAQWQAARNAAKAVIDLGEYALYKADPAPGDSLAQNYDDIFLQKQTSEDIFVRYFTKKSSAENWDTYNPGLFNNPNGYHGWGSNTPIQQFVDDYQLKDGSDFDWNDPVMAANPYANRDPRFYASILYNGAQWRQRPADVVASDPAGIIQTAFWEKWDSQTNSMNVVPGLDTRKGPIEDWNGTYTGYYLKKFIDPSVDAQYVPQELPWRFIRYAEVILNYAEACIELGEEDEARTYINMIRHRVRMPDITSSGDALRQACRHERRIELAYEDQRFFDVRRWMIAPQAYENAKGIEIRYKLNPDHTTSTTPTYTIMDIQERDWKDRFYFMPIKLDEMNRNDQLIQNPLY